MKNKKIDVEDLFNVECSCPVCNKCRFSEEIGKCMCGGPFEGYVEVSGLQANTNVLEENGK